MIGAPNDRDAAIALGKEAQYRAADPCRSAWVEAHAGSGKTHVLINRILRLILAGANPERIVCLTYTRAAAAEMTNRLIATLSAWAVLDEAALVEKLQDLTGTCPDDKQCGRARSAYAEIMSISGGLRLYTIHSFCERLLRRFPIEAGITTGFQVMDEAQISIRVAKVFRDVLNQAATSPEGALAKALGRLAVVLNDGGGSYDRRSLAILTRAVLNDHDRLVACLKEGFMARLADNFDLAGDDDEDAFYQSERARVDLEAFAPVLAELNAGKKTDIERSDALRGAFAKIHDDDFFAAYVAAFFTKAGKPRKRLVSQAIADKHRSFLESEQQHLMAACDRHNRVMIFNHTRDVLIFAAHINAAFIEAKKHRAALDFDDLIRYADLLLRTRESAQWVLYQLDQGLDHLLIDEAQDTSAQQWRIIRALAEPLLVESLDATMILPSSLFVVGDAKQSIFSFQGADPQGFHATGLQLAEQARACDHPWEAITLALSFRSGRAVLDGVDAVFNKLNIGQGDKSEWKDHIPFRSKVVGAMTLWPIFMPEEEEDSAHADHDAWEIPDRPISRRRGAMDLATAIATEITHLIGHATYVGKDGQEQKVAAADIMILLRRRDRQLMQSLAQSLSDHNIPIAGLDRMRLLEQLVISDLLAAARATLLPEDDFTLAVVLKSPLIGLTEEDLMHLAAGRRGRLWQSLGDAAKGEAGEFSARARFALERIEGWRGKIDYDSPFAFFMRLLEKEEGRARFRQRLGDTAIDPINEFLSLVLDYEADYASGLQGFISWIENQNPEIKRDMEQSDDAVRILTVHGAKGLEAPVVFLPDTLSSPWHSSHIPFLLWSDEDAVPYCRFNKPLIDDLAGSDCEIRRNFGDRLDHIKTKTALEHRRLLYVAMTRARDRLYVAGYRESTREYSPPANEIMRSWYDLIVDSDIVAESQPSAYADEGALTVPRAVPPRSDMMVEAPPWLFRAPSEEPVQRRWRPSRLDFDMGRDDDAEAGVIKGSDLASPLRQRRSTAAQRGILIHRLLDWLILRPAISRRIAARDWLKAQDPPITGNQADDLIMAVFRVLDDDRFAALFSSAGRSEVALVGDLPDLDKTAPPVEFLGRVDRLIVDGDRVIAVDFKTARRPPATLAATPMAYRRQMAAYRSALRAIFAGKTISCGLLWTEIPDLVMLPDELLDLALIDDRRVADEPNA